MADRTVDSILFLNQTADPTTWDAKTVLRMVEELESHQPEIIEADPAFLCQLSLKTGRPLWQPQCIVLTYEFPSRVHLNWIARAFPGVPIVSSYGSTETGHVFTQCQEGTFHQNTATCYVEVQPFRNERGDPDVGRLLVTTIGNPWFALVRFSVGDLVRTTVGTACPCGRADGMIVSAVEGRVRDLTFDSRGRAVTLKTLDDALGDVRDLTGYQVEQTDPQRYLVRFTARADTSAATTNRLQEALCRLYGLEARIVVQQVATIPPEQSGKFRLARSSMPVNAEELFRGG